MRWSRKLLAGLSTNYDRAMGVGVRALVWVALAAPVFAEDPLVERGFDHFYNLEYDQAIADFQQAIGHSPDSPSLHNDLAEVLVFREMYRDGAPEIEHQFLSEVARAMALCEARLKQNPKDTAAMYALGISYGLRADYHWLVQ